MPTFILPEESNTKKSLLDIYGELINSTRSAKSNLRVGISSFDNIEVSSNIKAELFKIINNLNMYLDEFFMPEFKSALFTVNNDDVSAIELETFIKSLLLNNVINPSVEKFFKDSKNI